MSVALSAPSNELTVADILEAFGPIPAWRIRHHPAPGTATVQDVIDILDHENRCCELVNGILVEKTVGFTEAFVTVTIIKIVGIFVDRHNLGIVTGPDGTIRLNPDLVRIPDVSFFSWTRLPGGRLPHEPVPFLSPDLAIEVLSLSNTVREMERKLIDFFDAGVLLVWYVDPRAKTVRVFTSPDAGTLLTETQTLDGGAVLLGFSIPVREFFVEPTALSS